MLLKCLFISVFISSSLTTNQKNWKKVYINNKFLESRHHRTEIVDLSDLTKCLEMGNLLKWARSACLKGNSCLLTNIIASETKNKTNFSECRLDVPKSMDKKEFIVTPTFEHKNALKFCESHNAEPFIPKTQHEFEFYIGLTVEQQPKQYAWYPINDRKKEGRLDLEDGEEYETSKFKLKKWSSFWLNFDITDCVTVDMFGEASWSRCFFNRFPMLCQKN
ncbi:UNVERIFIED_CONTAM: hypothetical protein RMT77_016616 [Armadillidium vulgare]